MEEQFSESVQEELTQEQEPSEYIYKSRRIENAKRSEFQRKLNMALLAVVVLLILLFWAIFNL